MASDGTELSGGLATAPRQPGNRSPPLTPGRLFNLSLVEKQFKLLGEREPNCRHGDID
jgi:hypothetical protein